MADAPDALEIATALIETIDYWEGDPNLEGRIASALLSARAEGEAAMRERAAQAAGLVPYPEKPTFGGLAKYISAIEARIRALPLSGEREHEKERT